MDLSFITQIINFLATKYSTVGMVLGYLVVIGIPLMTVLIDVLDTAVQYLNNSSYTAFAAKVDAIWKVVLPYLELLPHMNLPISTGVTKIVNTVLKVVAAIKAAVVSWFSTPSV